MMWEASYPDSNVTKARVMLKTSLYGLVNEDPDVTATPLCEMGRLRGNDMLINFTLTSFSFNLALLCMS